MIIATIKRHQNQSTGDAEESDIKPCKANIYEVTV